MAEMQQLKAKVKELNAKQIALNKEKAELDAKVSGYKRDENSEVVGTLVLLVTFIICLNFGFQFTAGPKPG